MVAARRDRRLAAAIVLGAIVCLVLIALVAFAPSDDPVVAPGPAVATAQATDNTGTRHRVHGDASVGTGSAEDAAAGSSAEEGQPVPRICRLDVLVRNEANDLPLAGAAVMYRDSEDAEWDAIADETGLAVMRDVSWSSGLLRVTAPGHAAVEEHVVGIPLGGRKAVEVRLRPERLLRVVVRDGWSEAPVSAALVQVFDFESGDWLPEADPGPLLSSQETNENGEAVLAGVPAGGCMIEVSGEGLETSFTGLRRNPDHDDTRVVTLWTSPGGVVFGRVLDEAGAPVADAPVRITWGRSSANQPVFRILLGDNTVLRGPAGATATGLLRALATTSDADGRYRFEGVRRGPTFFVHALNVLHKQISTRARHRLGRHSEDLECDVVVSEHPLTPLVDDGAFEFPPIDPNLGEATVTGRVVDDKGRGLDDARVWIAGETQATYSEPDGHFEIRGVPAGECTVRASKTLYTRASVDASAPRDGIVLVSSELPETDDEDTTGTPSVIHFTAIVDGEGPPPPALTVFGSFGLTTVQWSGRSRTRRFRVVLPKAPALTSVQISGAGVRPRVVALPAGRGAEIDVGDVHLDTGLVIRGRISDDTGAAAEGVTVNVLKHGKVFVSSTVTGRGGEFVAGGLTPGPHQLSTGSAQHAFSTLDLDIDDGDEPVQLVVQRLVRVRVRVRDAEGLPIFAARIRADALGGADVTTDRSGTAEIWLPPGRHSVGAYDPSTAQLATPQVVELEHGNASTEVILVLSRKPKQKWR